MARAQTMIAVSELQDLLGRSDVKVLDASWYLPGEPRDPFQEYVAARIPGARFFDIEAIADRNHACPHMLPTAEQFAQQVRVLGVGSDDQVIIYDHKGLFSAPRAWWMFRVFGHAQVRILSGGFPAWRAAGCPVESGETVPSESQPSFAAQYQSHWVADVARVRAAMATGDALILDARSPARFAGEEAEPRPGVRPGHVPTSRNLHYARLVAEGGQGLKPLAELRELFDAVGITDATSVVTTCGSGISACILALALNELGHSNVAVYDGSWAEWGADSDCPIEKG
ncbi:MAG: 3-mercaptopyruvate sulfurtransferase [Halieaceae bacterium]